MEFKREGIDRRRGHILLFQDSMLLTQFVVSSTSKLEEHYYQLFSLKDISLFTYVMGMKEKVIIIVEI
jgi:hypothetical protein